MKNSKGRWFSVENTVQRAHQYGGETFRFPMSFATLQNEIHSCLLSNPVL